MIICTSAHENLGHRFRVAEEPVRATLKCSGRVSNSNLADVDWPSCERVVLGTPDCESRFPGTIGISLILFDFVPMGENIVDLKPNGNGLVIKVNFIDLMDVMDLISLTQ